MPEDGSARKTTEKTRMSRRPNQNGGSDRPMNAVVVTE